MTTRGRDSQGASRGAILASYVPRLVEDVQRRGSNDGLLIFEGTLVSADISGFTALSERLAGLGHEGAEELTDLLNRCFGQMIEACEERGGDIVKFGGDALLVLFTDDDHAPRAVSAMEAMRSVVAQPWSTNSVRHVRLGISQGAHSGLFGFSLVDGGHLELLVGGPAVSRTVDYEAAAGRGQILLSPTTADLVPGAWLGKPSADGARPLRRGLAEVGAVGLVPLDPRRGIDGLDRYLAPPLIEQVLSTADGEHRQVAIAFVNAGGTDDLYLAEGPEALHEACQAVADNVREVLRAHPVHLLASDAYSNGAKMILTAGAPVSTDADDDHLLLALHDLFSRPSPLPLRAGANRGHVYVGDLGSTTRRTFTVMGDAVNLAARLMQKARPGQIVASAAILERARTTFHAEPLEPFLVKGKSKPIAAALLGDPIGHRRDDGESSEQTGIVEFVGRAAELASIDQLAVGALEGRGAVVEITGEAGIGKSRLVREALTRRPELTRHAFRGGQYAKNSPYFVVRVFLRELIAVAESDDPRTVGARLRSWVGSNAPALTSWLPLLAIAVGAEVDATPEVDRIGEEFRRERLLAAVTDVIDAALGDRVALIAEDVHLFDSASQDVIARLARRAADRAWLVVLVHRGVLDLGLESARRKESIDLVALDADDARRLAEVATRIPGSSDHFGDARQIERLADRAGGNPLYLLELLSAGLDSEHDEALPESIESLVTTRIDKLPAQDRVLLREASVAGLVIDTTLIAESFDRPDLVAPDRWHALGDFLEHRGGDRFRFRHDLYRAVAYEGLAYRRRRHVHRSLGHTLERRHAGDLARVAPLLSTHFDRGRDDDRAWTYSVLAADTSRAGYANDEAVMLYRRALDHAAAAPAEPEEVARVAEALADVHLLSARYPSAVEAYQHSRRANRASISREARMLRKIGSVREREGHLSHALRWYSRASRALTAVPEGDERRLEEAEIALARAGTLHRQGRHRMSARFAGLAAAAAEAGHDRLALARAYNILWVAQTSLGVADAATWAHKALDMYQGSGDLVGEANVVNNLGIEAYYAGDWHAAVEYYTVSRDLRRQAGDVAGEALAANNLAEVMSLQGRYDEASELFGFAQRTWETAGYPWMVAFAMANLAVARARAGEPRAGLATLGSARFLSLELGASALRLEMDVRRIECLLLDRQFDRALAEAVPLCDELDAHHEGDNELTTQLLPLLALAQWATGDRAASEKTVHRTIQQAEAESNHYVAALGSLVEAEMAATRGVDPAAAHDRASDVLEGLGLVALPAVVALVLPGLSLRPTAGRVTGIGDEPG